MSCRGKHPGLERGKSVSEPRGKRGRAWETSLLFESTCTSSPLRAYYQHYESLPYTDKGFCVLQEYFQFRQFPYVIDDLLPPKAGLAQFR